MKMSFEEYKENERRLESRAKVLGFKPQKEIIFNSLLPYCNVLDEESTRLFAEIKCNLGKAVALREMRPGCAVWTSRLIKYIKLYGLKFSKDDHIMLVKLLYEMILIPELEPVKLAKFSTVFIMLTSRRYLISPDELTLQWRPLYELGIKLFDSSAASFGMVNTIYTLESTFESVVRCAKPYFPPGTTQEVLDTLKGWICPWTLDTRKIIDKLILFLPVTNPDEYCLWWDDVWRLWNTCYNCNAGIGKFMQLFGEISKRCPGTIDWSPYVANMFSRFLRSFNLPIGSSNDSFIKAHTLDAKSVATWIAWNIEPSGVVLAHLKTFLAAIESYLYSANTGSWSGRLRSFLKKLTHEFLMRYHRETHPKFRRSWEMKTPENHRLRDVDIDEFVKLVSEPCLHGLHARNGAGDVRCALRDLATLRPALVVPRLIERLQVALESLTEPHRVTAAMQAVAAVARPLLRGPKANYPEGQAHIPNLLLATIPAVDPNDPKKTLVALQFISTYCTMIPLVDCSKVLSEYDDLTEEECLALEGTAHFEDFLLLFFDRIFLLVESSALEQAQGVKEVDSSKSRLETTIETAILTTLTVLLMQCEPKLYDAVLKKLKNFVFNSTYETKVAGSVVGHMIHAFTRVDAKKALAAFIPRLCSEILDIVNVDGCRTDTQTSNELLYRLLLFSHVLDAEGSAIVEHEEAICEVIESTLRMHCREAVELSCESLYNMLSSLGERYVLEFRSSTHSFENPWASVREWGEGCPIASAELKFADPGPAQLECAQRILERIVSRQLNKLSLWADGKLEMHRERLWRGLIVLHAALSCTSLMPPPTEPPVLLLESKVEPTSFLLELGFRGLLYMDNIDIRVAITDTAHAVQKRLLDEKSDDTLALCALACLWERLGSVWGGGAGGGRSSKGSAHGVGLRTRSLLTAQRLLCGKAGPRPGDGRLRFLLAEGVYVQHDMRVELSSDAGPGRSLVRVAEALLQLAAHPYTVVRAQAQPRLQWIAAQHAHSTRALLPKILGLLTPDDRLTPEEAHARHKGILHTLLGPANNPLVLKRDWEILRELWPAILKTPLSEKPSIIRLESLLVETVNYHFSKLNIKQQITQEAVDCAINLIPDTELNKSEFEEMLNEAADREQRSWEVIEKSYHDLLDDLADIIEDPTTHWRRLLQSIQLLGVTVCDWTSRTCSVIAKTTLHHHPLARKHAIRLTLYAIKQAKPKRPTVVLETEEHTFPGYCSANKFALCCEKLTFNDFDDDTPRLHNMRAGFFAWPKPLKVPAPPSQQISADRDVSLLSDRERALYDFFINDTNLDKLINLFATEERKESEKNDGHRVVMLKCLFRLLGERVATKFLNRIESLVTSTEESAIHCASEIIGASLRAPKHWLKESRDRIQGKALKLLDIGISNAMPDNVEEWVTAANVSVSDLSPDIAGSMLNVLVENLKKLSIHSEAHTVCTHLYMLQMAICCQSWRSAPLAKQVYNILQDGGYFAHSYQMVRIRASGLITIILDLELKFEGADEDHEPPGPKLETFLDWALKSLSVLYDEDGELNLPPGIGAIHTPSAPAASMRSVARVPSARRVMPAALVCAALSPMEEEGVPGVLDSEPRRELKLHSNNAGDPPSALPEETEQNDLCEMQSEEHATAVSLLSTVLRVCASSIAISSGGVRPAHYKILRIACSVPPRDNHIEIASAAAVFLKELAKSPHNKQLLETALTSVEDTLTSKLWRTRESVAHFVQILVFHALPILKESPETVLRVQRIAHKLLDDERSEVRTAGTKLLAGLMHCGALPDEHAVLKALAVDTKSKNIVRRRRGVLGLCAYVSSRPYSIPKYLSLALEALTDAGITSDTREAVRNTLADFKRTHLDDWSAHFAALEPRQIELLSELAQPPDYCV